MHYRACQLQACLLLLAGCGLWVSFYSARLAALTDTLYLQGERVVQQAQRLNHDLTPSGAERHGNGADIPVWRGGLTMPPLGYKGSGHRRPDPYPDDPLLYQLSATNAASYHAVLTPGLHALLRYPGVTFPVYPTRRTAAAPAFWYDQTYDNLLQSSASSDMTRGGVPFPIPKSGQALLFNTLLHWQGRQFHSFERVYAVHGETQESWPLAVQAVFTYGMVPDEPGFQFSIHAAPNADYAHSPRVAWWFDWRERRLDQPFQRQYVVSAAVGGIHVSELENAVPPPVALSPVSVSGPLNHYQWRLLGKRELLIPYNNYRLFDEQPGYAGFLTPDSPNMQRLRFEKHRLWVLEGRLIKGMTGAYARQVLYIDEDSWATAMVDRYDHNDELVGIGLSLLTSAYEIPAVIAEFRLEFDLLNHRYWFYAIDDMISFSRDYSRLSISRNRTTLD